MMIHKTNRNNAIISNFLINKNQNETNKMQFKYRVFVFVKNYTVGLDSHSGRSS